MPAMTPCQTISLIGAIDLENGALPIDLGTLFLDDRMPNSLDGLAGLVVVSGPLAESLFFFGVQLAKEHVSTRERFDGWEN